MTPRMVNKISGRKHKLDDCVVDALKKKTHFSKEEIEKLYNSFKNFTSTSNFSQECPSFSYTSRSELEKKVGIDRITFKEILHNIFQIFTEDMIMDKIFNAFDKRSDGIIHLDEWILGLSVFLKGTLEQRISLCFFIYDLNSDGAITKDEILSLLRNSLPKLPHDEDPDDSIKELADIILKKLDCDRDGKISLQDFNEAIKKDNLLLESLGQCLPTEQVCKTYISSIA